MPEDKKKEQSQSFSRLLRGSSPGQEILTKEQPASKPFLVGDAVKREEMGKKKPIFLPFLKGGDKDSSILSIGYKEWTFLLSAVLLFFGGMGVIRYLAPKEGQITPAFEVPPTDIDEGARAPGEGEPTDEIVSSANKLRDTTRLVQGTSGGDTSKLDAGKTDAKKSPTDQLKDSFWSGLKETERGAGKAPRLPGMFGALNALLGGGGGGGAPPVRTMSPEEIAARVKAISPNPPGGGEGYRLGYSGAQGVPGARRSGRSKYSSSGDQFRKMRQDGRDKLAGLTSDAEKKAAEAAKAFDGTSGSSAGGGGASTGGESPAQQKSEPDNVDYKIGRDPIADEWAKWQLEKQKEIWKATWLELIKFGVKHAMGGVEDPSVVTAMQKPNGEIGQAKAVLNDLGCDTGAVEKVVSVADPFWDPQKGACTTSFTGVVKKKNKSEEGKGSESEEKGSFTCTLTKIPSTEDCNKIEITTLKVPGDCSGLACVFGGISSGVPKVLGLAPKLIGKGVGLLNNTKPNGSQETSTRDTEASSDVADADTDP